MSLSSDASPSKAAGNVLKFPKSASPARGGWPTIWRPIWRRARSGLRSHGFTAGVVGLTTAGIAVGIWSFSAASTPRYTTVAAARGAVARAVTATGTVNPAQTVVVSAAVSGTVQSLNCGDDSEVKAGQVCAKIDPRPYQAQLDQYSAQLQRDQAILDKDRADLARIKRHAAENPFARAQIAEQSLVVSRDEGSVKLDLALLGSAKLNLGYTNIVAPVDGMVVARNVREGEPVAANAAALFVIAADPRHMEIDADPSQGDIGAVRRGNRAIMTVEGLPDRVFHGTVSRVRRLPGNRHGAASYDAVVAVDNSDLILKPGMIASTQIIVDQRSDVLRVPDQALQFIPSAAKAESAAGPVKEQPHVWVLRGNVPVAVDVATGLDDGKFTEVVQGELSPGDQVIVAENRPLAQTSSSGAP
jgi:HlyD family secretion protein